MALIDRDLQVMESGAQTLAAHRQTLLGYIEEVQAAAQSLQGSFDGAGSEEFQNAINSDIQQMNQFYEVIGTFVTALNEDIEATREFERSNTSTYGTRR